MKPCLAIGCNFLLENDAHRDFCKFCRPIASANEDQTNERLKQNEGIPAPEFLRAGMQHMEDRAVQYDAEGGERSMAKTVAMFNTLTDNNITETQGWKFMALLKVVRSEQGPFKADTYQDGSAFMGLAGESHSKESTQECSS